MPLFEALDSLTWPRIHSSRNGRPSSPKSISSTGAVIDTITSSSGSERDGLITTNVDVQDRTYNPESNLHRTLSRSSAPRSMPQSPDLIMCSDRSATIRKTYVPHLPQTQTTFKPIFSDQKKLQEQQQQQHYQHKKHRKKQIEPLPISGSDPEEPEPDLPTPMQSTSISRLSPMISPGAHGNPLNSQKRKTFAALYGNKKASSYHKDRSLSPLSEGNNRPISPRRKRSVEPVAPSSPGNASPMPAPSWSSQVDEAFKRLQLTKQTDIDVLKTSIV